MYRLRTSLCLQFKPHQIAAGAIFMAAKFLKIKLPSGGEKVWWQGFDVTPRHLEGWSRDGNSVGQYLHCTKMVFIFHGGLYYASPLVAAVVAAC